MDDRGRMKAVAVSGLLAAALAAAGPGVGGVARGAPKAVPEVGWHRLANGPDRALHSMIYDPVGQFFWTFGGVEADFESNRFRNDVWRLDATDPEAPWRRMPIDGLQPPPTELHTAIYDPLRHRMVVYGGLVDRNRYADQRAADGNSVWFLDLDDPDDPTWRRVSVFGNDTDRFAHAAAYVPELDAMVVSGGARTFDQLRGDHYALLMGQEPMTWVRLANAGFAPRAGHALLHDGAGERLVSYGGLDDFGTLDATAEMVTLDLSAGLDGADRWQRLTPAAPGLRRAFAAPAFDPVRQLWWFHGGLQDNDTFYNDLSVLDLTADPPVWKRTLVVRNGPLVRFGHVAAWDGPRDRMVVQGGTPDNARTLADTYELTMGAGTATATATSVTPTSTGTTSATSGPVTSTATPTDPATAVPTATGPTPTGPTPTETPPAVASQTSTATATATATRPPDPGRSPTPGTAVPAAEVAIDSYAFVPNPITVTVGTSVRWVNLDPVPHTTTSGAPGAPDGVWDSGFLVEGGAYSHVFSAAGTFPYYCRVHPNMLGTVVVTGGSSGPRMRIFLPALRRS